jgi:ABC-2 type transport system permease protein
MSAQTIHHPESTVPAVLAEKLGRAGAPVTTAVKPIPMSRIVGVELSKMFNTRAGFWLLTSIGILATIATVSVIVFAPDSAINYGTFSSAVGVPMAVVLPVIAILSVTSEWSQRNGLTTFTLVPHRGKVIWAKAISAIAVGVVAMLVAMAVGAVGNLVGAAIVGVDPVWGFTFTDFWHIILASVLGLMIGFTLGIVIRNSAGAVVAYFVYAFVIPTIFGVLAGFQSWFADLQPWIDFNYASTMLYDETMAREDWAHLATAGTIWLVLPLLLGLWMLRRSEVK